MIQWKQRLYAFLLRRVLGPLLDASDAHKLHDSIEFSLQEGKFILKDVQLNVEYLSERMVTSGSTLGIRRVRVQRLEICLSLRENQLASSVGNGTTTPVAQSSLAWRAMKLGGGPTAESSLPAVSLVATVHVEGVDLELVPLDPSQRQRKRAKPPSTNPVGAETIEDSPRTMIGSYVDSALASLRLNLKLSNIHIKLCHQATWVQFKLSSMTYKDLDQQPGYVTASYKTLLNKSLELSDITVHSGEDGADPLSTVLAMAKGSGRAFVRVIEYSSPATSSKENSNTRSISQDIEVSLNHQLNISLDHSSLRFLHTVADGFAESKFDNDQQSDDRHDPSPQMMASTHNTSSLLRNPLFDNEETDRQDLKAITGIMKQYREAYHLAENNQLRGGILVPSHAYIDDLDELEEDDAMTFDVFFDANDQSFYNAASTLKESVLMLDASDESGAGNSIQTKIRLHLLSGCIKINFRDSLQRQQQYAVPQEYILLTMDDLNVSLSSSRRRSELSCSVAHFEIEDAQLDTKNPKFKGPGTVDIGSLLSFLSGSADADDYENEAVVSQAPCLTLHVQLSKKHKGQKSMDCTLTLLPIEVIFRQRSLANLSNFAFQLGNNTGSSNPQTIEKQSPDNMQISFSCSCPSLTLSMPLLKSASTAPLFNRCGETLSNVQVRDAFLGLTLGTLDFQWNKGDNETSERGLESCAKLSVFHGFVFACAPIGDKVSLGAKMQRTDFVLLNGRTEVNPCIPITLEYLKVTPSLKDGSVGRETFPIVPAITSFKARQEDEDEQLKIDRLLFSKLHDLDADSRKDLRGPDPQIAMVMDSEKSDAVVSVSIPEVILDLTKAELETLLEMIDLVKPPSQSATMGYKNSSDKSHSATCRLSIAVNVDQISLSSKEDFRIEDLYGDRSKKERFSCLFAVNKFRTHILLHGSKLRHLRVLAHDVGLYSAFHYRIDAEVGHGERDIRQRTASVKQRIRIYKEALVTPILYRSHKFTPICQDAPSFLLDIRDTTSISSNGVAQDFTQMQVYLTLYHLTFRYDVDSDWIERVKGLLPLNNNSTDPFASSESTAKHEGSPSMTRVFMTAADCNFDYTSPGYFEMESRSIIRLGDFRFSSNIMSPVSRNQAYSLSLGDLSYHLSTRIIPYLDEDMKLCRASIIMPTYYSKATQNNDRSIHGTTSEALLREMNFVEVLGLDSMDAVVAITKWDIPGRTRQPSTDPRTTVSLTFGTLSVSACTDSFKCFTATVGELQAKLTALTDEDVARVKRESLTRVRHEKPLTNIATPQISTSQLPRQNASTDEQGGAESEVFLLDGYDWTDIDHDPLLEMEIPDGDEQIAGWYNTSLVFSGSPSAAVETADNPRFPVRIVHHHFPFHSISNPMADGDMGAPKYAGEGSIITLKSRLLVHRLTVKLRFYDGYDWPEKLRDRQKIFLKKHGKFVIEPVHAREAVEAKKTFAKDVSDRIEDDFGQEAASMKRKVAIMADLLAMDGDKEKEKSPFENAPLPADRARSIDQETELRRLSRKSQLYLQVSANGVSVRVDAYEESSTHRLASVIGVSVSDMFIAETASLSYPVKMLGEWVNEKEHPRDTRFGTLMLKMITWKPLHPVTVENKIECDDCEITLQLLPMRAIIDQHAIVFTRAFFHNEEDEEEKKGLWSAHLHLLPPPRFRAFRVKPWKLKVDYSPQNLDVGALRDGSIVELINVSPIDGMVITLNQVSVERVVGFGQVMGELTSNWLQEIVSTQLHKFLANARPFEPISHVGQGVCDLVVLPYEAFKNGDDIRRAMGEGFKSLAETVTFQALTTTSRLTEYAANKMATVIGCRYHNSAGNPLPIRPTNAPKGVQDVTGHAMASIARGIQAANYKIVIIPFREYGRNGATGAATSVLRGIPVMLVAPLTGATEALSYTLLGARNALRPDIRREEEASRTGFTSYDV